MLVPLSPQRVVDSAVLALFLGPVELREHFAAVHRYMLMGMGSVASVFVRTLHEVRNATTHVGMGTTLSGSFGSNSARELTQVMVATAWERTMHAMHLQVSFVRVLLCVHSFGIDCEGLH